MKVYRLFGLSMASDFPFAGCLQESSGSAASSESADLTFVLQESTPPELDWSSEPTLYESPNQHAEEGSISSLHRFSDFEVLRFKDIADFHLRPQRIDAYLHPEGNAIDLEIRLLGAVFAYVLETRGLPALHASAVEIEGRAAVFIAGNGGGKTSLAATLLQAGHPLLTDDLLAIQAGEIQKGVAVQEDAVQEGARHISHVQEGARHISQAPFLGQAGYPQMRMWPDEAQRFLGQYEHLEVFYPGLTKRRVPIGEDGFGSFCNAPLPLGCLYSVERRTAEDDSGLEVRIQTMPFGMALMELIRHTFSPFIVEAVGLQAQRLDVFAELLKAVPFRTLSYPSGYQHLPDVVEAIRQDLLQTLQTSSYQ